jgi:hypothetical protein
MAKRKTLAKKGRKNRRTRRNLLKRGGGWKRDILSYTGLVDSTAKHREKKRPEMTDEEYEKELEKFYENGYNRHWKK